MNKHLPPETLLADALTQNQLTCSHQQQAQLLAYLTLLIKWNKVFNLTHITSWPEMIYLHLIDSLIIQPHLHGQRFADIGSGAGLPGIPLAITQPAQHWTLLDKNNKKTRFLTQVVAELGLKNVEIAKMRSEEFHPDSGFDSILSRAFGSLAHFQQATKHLLGQNGVYIAMKGKYPEAELQELSLSAHVQGVIPLTMTGMPIERHLVVFKDQ